MSGVVVWSEAVGHSGGPGPAPVLRESRESREAMASLVREHFVFVWRSLRRLGLGESDAEDATQRVMLVLAQRIADIDVGCERAFLFRTAVYVASKFHRAAHCRPETAEDGAGERADPAPDPEQLLARRRTRERLDAVLAELPLELRAAFVLFEIEGLSQPEIAEALGIPKGTVASRLRRARKDFARLASRAGLIGATGAFE